MLDDHLHAVPREVVELLALVPADATVVLERDGNYPTIEDLLEELWSAAALAAAFIRAEGAPAPPVPQDGKAAAPPALPPAAALHTLAELYTDADARERFLANPTGPLATINPDDLRLAARSFEHKRKRSHLVHEVRAER